MNILMGNIHGINKSILMPHKNVIVKLKNITDELSKSKRKNELFIERRIILSSKQGRLMLKKLVPFIEKHFCGSVD